MKIATNAVSAFAILIGGAVGTNAQDADDAFAAVRAANEKYMDVDAALAAGYIKDPSGECVDATEAGMPPEMGGMGVHYLNMAKLGITGNNPVTGDGTHTDFDDPAILLYEPQADGSMVLVGVENLVFQDAWKAAGNTEPPSFAGVVWDAMADDPATPAHEAHGFAPHFDRHIWLFRDNPAGVFAPFNPNVTCQYH